MGENQMKLIRLILTCVLLSFSSYALATPNIVVIMTDDDAVNTLALQPKVQSLLVEKGVSFTNAYSALSSCCPDRATLLRGQFPHNHGVTTNEPPNGGWARFKNL